MTCGGRLAVFQLARSDVGLENQPRSTESIQLSTLEMHIPLDLLTILQPKRSPFPLMRIGGRTDGAYLLPNDLGGIEACFSPGVNNTKDFEDELTLRYGIQCHMCDFSSDVHKLKTPLIEGEQSFIKKWLDVDGSSDSITLEEWVRSACRSEKSDLILQMDIEGAEYRNILACPDEILSRFRIIAIELHGLSEMQLAPPHDATITPILRKLDRNFVCIHAHPNNCCGETWLEGTQWNVPNVLELTWIRRDRLHLASNRHTYAPCMPHRLDIDLNDPTRHPLFLSAAWYSNGRRPFVASLFAFKAWLHYYIRSILRWLKRRSNLR